MEGNFLFYFFWFLGGPEMFLPIVKKILASEIFLGS